MVDDSGKLEKFSESEISLLLNKIMIGDILINTSDKILGIGGDKVIKELELYFPQFTTPKIKPKVKMISEGIKTDKDMFNNDDNIQVCEASDLIGIDPSFCEGPIILNVGRLAAQKGQVELFKAWANSKMSESHNLLIIGGDLESPNAEEKSIIDFFNQELEKMPHLKNKFFHKRAMHNERIRLVEKSIVQKTFD